MLENLFLDGTMLVFTLFLMRKKICIGRVLMAALTGAVTSTVMLVTRLSYGMLYILILFGMGAVMMWIAMKQKRINDILVGTVYYFTLAFVFSQLFRGGVRITQSRSGIVMVVLSIIGIMSGTLFYVIRQNQKKRQNALYRVAIVEQGQQIEVRALLDTGNALTEPFSGKPVSVIESKVWHLVCREQTPESFRVIPFHSIGQEHGILRGAQIDELIIWAGDRKIVQKQAVIALYDGSLSKDESYQMILHQGLLN